MTLPPWEYLLLAFNPGEGEAGFPDLFNPIWITAAVLLVLQVIIYNVRTRQLHRFEPLANMQEWLLWTGVITFFMVIVEAIFKWYFLTVLITLGLGLAA